MKFVCSQSELLNALNIALKAVPSKTSLPILECILIEAGESNIKITTNDMELGIETVVNAEVTEKGKIALNAKIFSDIVRKLPEDTVKIEVGENNASSITCGKAKFMIVGQNGDEFPLLPAIEKKEAVTISQFMLKELIRQTIFSVSDNENNKIMTGEFFEINENEMKVTSLDGHRISIRNVKLKETYPSVNANIPGKTLQEIGRILPGDMDQEVNLYFMERYVMVEFNQTVILSRLIEGKYYNVNQMISSAYDTKIVVNKREMMSCIDRAILLVKESEKRPVIIDIHDEGISLNMNSSIGNMDEEITVYKEGSDLTIGFNPKFLMDALRAIDDDEIAIYMTNAKAPCFIRDVENSYIYLILPVNFSTR